MQSNVAGQGNLTLEDVAKELRCSKAHVSNLANGKVHGLPPLPVVRMGRRALVRPEALNKWLTALEGSAKITEDLNSSRVTSEKD